MTVIVDAAGFKKMSFQRRTWAVTIVFIIAGYYILGVSLFPQLLIPIGCSGEMGTKHAPTIPTTEFKVSYGASSDTLTVRHTGGDTLYTNTTEQITITVERSSNVQRRSWRSAGGTYPIAKGSHVSISDISKANNSTAIVRVQWTGNLRNYPDYPPYCPGSNGAERTNTGTLARSEI
jgi:hypothetical protein